MDYPHDSQFEDYHDFYASVLMDAYFVLHEHHGFDYVIVQDRYNTRMSVGYPEHVAAQVWLPASWLAV